MVKDRNFEAPELYDLINDPGETTNIAAQNRDIVKNLTQRIMEFDREVEKEKASRMVD